MILKEISITENPELGRLELIDNLDEAELVKRAKTDSEAFGLLYDHTYNRILNYIFRRTLNITLAEELTSNTYFKALRALPKYRYRAPFIAWLYRIASNEIRMHYRKDKSKTEIVQDPRWVSEIDRLSFNSPEDTIISENEIEEQMLKFSYLQELVQMLPENYQTVIVLRYFENLSIIEVSQVLGKKVGTVKSLINRGLKRLRILIEESDNSLELMKDKSTIY